jgi:hypothetical protein
VLFPVRVVDYEVIAQWQCFDSDLGIDLASCVREYLVADFSEWQDKSRFSEALVKVVASLQDAAKEEQS